MSAFYVYDVPSDTGVTGQPIEVLPSGTRRIVSADNPGFLAARDDGAVTEVCGYTVISGATGVDGNVVYVLRNEVTGAYARVPSTHPAIARYVDEYGIALPDPALYSAPPKPQAPHPPATIRRNEYSSRMFSDEWEIYGKTIDDLVRTRASYCAEFDYAHDTEGVDEPAIAEKIDSLAEGIATRKSAIRALYPDA